ncbi:iron ABC transporter permease [Luedemannella helvata]|uniref:Siderophore ABC transporter permease CdtC n=1 Tax=Luedemannella helvata TaxID=349315 RepID=A0ABN2JW35_9ACTN
MSQLATVAQGPALAPAPKAAQPRAGRTRLTVVFAVAVASVALLAAVHLTQGTSTVGVADLARLLAGGESDETVRVLLASRLPRLLAALVAGLCLGVAGAALQSIARNTLASPDTLAVTSGAHLAVTVAAAFGLSLPLLAAGGLAFLGGLAAAGLVLALSAGGRSGPTRLILAGSATTLALSSLTTLLFLLFEQETVGLYAWGNGSLNLADLNAVALVAPVIGITMIGMLLLGRRMDILRLGDDSAATLGLNVRRLRVFAVLLAVLLCASAVTLVGPIAFVGLCAPAIARLATPLAPGLQRHRVLLPLAGLAGMLVMIAADVLLRAVLGAQAGVDIPTGVVTTIAGAAVLIWLARRHRDSGRSARAAGTRPAKLRSGRFAAGVTVVCAVAVVASGALGMLAGDTWVLFGDVVNWLRDQTGPAYTFVLDARWPRVAAGLLAGAALAVAGTAVQAVSRNPLAEPSILGVTGGAGVGAVALISFVPTAGVWAMTGVAGVGALLAFALVYGLAWRRGLHADRLILIGVAVSYACTAIITFIIIATDPWNTGKALTWLSGSTYGRTAGQIVPVLVALVVLTPLIASTHRDLDLMQLDDDTPRLLGVRVERSRLVALGAAALLAATAVSAVGVIGFVGLVAPHIARALVGGAHARLLPVAALLGALLVSLSDTLGRTVIAPAQIPAGLVTAMVGTPYFIYLLWRSRRNAVDIT